MPCIIARVLDALLARHVLLQSTRIAAAAFLLLLLVALGAAILKRCGVIVGNGTERILLSAAAGFAAYQFCVRWLAELPVASPLGIGAIVLLLAIAAAPGWRSLRDDLHGARLPRDGWSIAILLLLIAPLTMALAPAVSRDALVYHLRFPEMTLRLGSWAYDPASSTSFNPAAAGTLYLPALAADASGVSAQLVHFGFFVLCIVAAAHNAHFLNPLPAAIGIESERDYIHRTVSAAPLFERADRILPPHARVLAINEVRLFRFPRPVSASRIVDPPLVRRYLAAAATPQIVIERLRRDGFTHVLIATRPVERGAGLRLTREEERLVTATLRMCKVVDREGNTMLLELPAIAR